MNKQHTVVINRLRKRNIRRMCCTAENQWGGLLAPTSMRTWTKNTAAHTFLLTFTSCFFFLFFSFISLWNDKCSVPITFSEGLWNRCSTAGQLCYPLFIMPRQFDWQDGTSDFPLKAEWIRGKLPWKIKQSETTQQAVSLSLSKRRLLLFCNWAFCQNITSVVICSDIIHFIWRLIMFICSL